MTERACTLCGVVKPMSEFSKGNALGGYKSYCKACQSAANKDYAARNKARKREAPTEKRCPACARILPGTAFYVSRRTSDGVQSYCKECQNKITHRWNESNKERVTQWRANYYQAYRSHWRALDRAWAKANPLLKRSSMRRYQARKAGSTTDKVDYTTIWERDKGICYLCGQPIDRSDVHFDHVIPLSKGGSHTSDNIRAAHSLCNLRKADKIIDAARLPQL